MKALVGAFNQEKVLVGAFSVIVQLHQLIDLWHYSPPSDAVTPRERGNERHDVLARHTDTCHTLVTCHVSSAMAADTL